MQTILAFIIIFGSLVFFHELGHFIFAKRAGILVREFAIGMGPKIIGIQRGETVYTIRLLPIGGYVRMAGEEFDNVELQPGYRVALQLNEEGKVKKVILNQREAHPNVIFLEVERADLMKGLWIEGYDEDATDEDTIRRYEVARDAIIVENGQELMIAPEDRQFNSKTVGQRAMTIFAGPLFNFILAFFIFLAIGLIQGQPTFEPIIKTVQDEGPAIEAGMQDGDLVKSINGEEITVWQDLSETIQESPGKPLHFIVERNGQDVDLLITPETVKDDAGNEYGKIGVVYETPFEPAPLQAFPDALEKTYDYSLLIFQAVGKLITGEFTINDLSGPVGIYKQTEEVVQWGIFNLMTWAGILSINLGIMNLLPLPALDGGRLLFFGFEAIRGKPVDRQKEGLVHFVGIVLLMVLMVVVTWNDIQRFFFQ